VPEPNKSAASAKPVDALASVFVIEIRSNLVSASADARLSTIGSGA
jgi:hypothetical protein